MNINFGKFYTTTQEIYDYISNARLDKDTLIEVAGYNIGLKCFIIEGSARSYFISAEDMQYLKEI